MVPRDVRFRPSVTTVAAAVCLLCTLSLARGQVVIRNAGFEVLDPAGETPVGWVYIEPKDGDGSFAVDEGREGGHSARVECTRLEEGWGPGFGQSGVVAVAGDQWYEVRFRARAEGLRRGAFVALRDTTDWAANRLWKAFFPGPAWREHRIKFYSKAPLAAEVSRFQFSFDSTGTLWIDDVALAKAEPEPPANLLDVAGRRNLLPNSSFELGAAGWATYGADELFGEIDASTAAHGRQSFRIAMAEGGLPVYRNDFTYRLRARSSHEKVRKLPVCPIGYCPVEKGKRVAFSFSVKGSRAGTPVVAGVLDGRGKATTRTFTATADWQRFAFSAVPQDDIAFVTVGVDADSSPELPVVLWVDALQLELGEDSSEYESCFPVEGALDTGKEANVYTHGEAATPRLVLASCVDVRTEVDVTVEVEDFFGNRERGVERRVALTPGQVLSEGVDLGITEPGFYRLHLSVAADGWRTSRGMRAAVVYPFEREYAGADGFLGVNHAFVSDLYMRRARAMGVTWVRSWFCKWEDVESERGRFDFAEADAQFAWVKTHGMNVMLCLSDPTSEWASSAPPVVPGTTGGEAQSRRVWWLPTSFADYERYVREVAGHFGDQVRDYEVFNEPNDRKGGDGNTLDLCRTYPTFLDHAGKAVRSVSAENRVFGAGLGYFKELPDLSPIVSRIDVLSEHRYPGLAPTLNLLDDFGRVREKLSSSGSVRPIWVTEYGLYADDDPDPTTAQSRFMQHYGADSERLAATHVAKHHIALLASGVEKVFFHIGNWPFRVNREHGCGFHAFFEWGGVPRKTYVALNTLAWLLPPGTRHLRTWEGPNHFFAFEFQHGATRVFPLWAEGGLEPPAAAVRALNDSGATFTHVAGGRLGGLPGVIEDSPVYVRASSSGQVRAVSAFLVAVGARERATGGAAP